MSGRMTSKNAIEHRIGMRHRADLSVAKRAQALVVEERCLMVHTHTVRGALIAGQVKLRTGLPWIHHMHSPALHETSRIGRNLANFAAEAATLWRADIIVAVSEAMARYAAKYYRIGRARIAIVPNGVAEEPILPRGDASSAETIITVVGLFRPRKGILVLINAISQMPRTGRRFRLRLVGEFSEPAYEGQVRDQVHSLNLTDEVDFVGFTADVRTELEHGDIFVFPSLHGEGMPMAILEAMAAGRPVIASDIDGVHELLAGGAGILVPAGQPEPLALAISELMNDPSRARAIGSRGRDRQRARYNVATMCRSVFAVYDEVASRLSGSSSKFGHGMSVGADGETSDN